MYVEPPNHHSPADQKQAANLAVSSDVTVHAILSDGHSVSPVSPESMCEASHKLCYIFLNILGEKV